LITSEIPSTDCSVLMLFARYLIQTT